MPKNDYNSEDNIYLIMQLTVRIEAIIEKLEQKGLLTKKEIEKREIELIKQKLEEMKQMQVKK